MTPPAFVAYCGLPGVGKSTAAKYTAKRLNTSRLRTDVVRKELFDEPTYTAAEDNTTYEELFRRARETLTDGEAVVLDATFGCKRHRSAATNTADDVGVDLTFVHVVCDQDTVERRIRDRSDTVSDADVETYRMLREAYDPFTHDHVEIDNSGTIADLEAEIDRRVHTRLPPRQ